MFNITVLKLKDVVKYVCEMVFTIVILITISKFFNKESNDENINKFIQDGVQTIPQNSMISCLDKTVPAISSINEEEGSSEEENEDFLKEMLGTQISSIKGIEKFEESKESDNLENIDNNSQQEEIQLARNKSSNASNN